MKSKKEIRELLSTAFAAGCSVVEIDGVKYVRKKKKPKEEVPTKDFPVPEGMTEEEILFYSTPYYDEIQENKKKREEQLKLERSLRNG